MRGALAGPPLAQRAGGEVLPGAHAERCPLGVSVGHQVDLSQHPESGGRVLREDRGVASIRLDDQTQRVQSCHAVGTRIAEAEGDHIAHHGGREAVHRVLTRGSDEQVHAQVAGLFGQFVGGDQQRRAVGLDVEERCAGVPGVGRRAPTPDPAVLRGMRGHGLQVLADLLETVILHLPVAGMRGGQPGVDRLGILRGPDRGEGEGAHEGTPAGRGRAAWV